MRQTPQTVSPMSNQGRNAYVLQHITGAFLELLKEKSLGEISISELCENAGVGRASFYRNFGNKEDILKAHLHEIFREWVTEYEKVPGRPLSELIQTLFAHFEKHRDFYSLLNESGYILLLKDTIIGIFDLNAELPAQEAYAKAYVAYSLYGWVEVWFQRGMRETAEEMAALFWTQGL